MSIRVINRSPFPYGGQLVVVDSRNQITTRENFTIPAATTGRPVVLFMRTFTLAAGSYLGLRLFLGSATSPSAILVAYSTTINIDIGPDGKVTSFSAPAPSPDSRVQVTGVSCGGTVTLVGTAPLGPATPPAFVSPTPPPTYTKAILVLAGQTTDVAVPRWLTGATLTAENGSTATLVFSGAGATANADLRPAGGAGCSIMETPEGKDEDDVETGCAQINLDFLQLQNDIASGADPRQIEEDKRQLRLDIRAEIRRLEQLLQDPALQPDPCACPTEKTGGTENWMSMVRNMYRDAAT